MVLTCLTVSGCSQGGRLEPTSGDSGGADSGGGGTYGGPGGGGSGGAGSAGSDGGASGTGPETPGAVGLVVIDVQETFVDGAKNPDISSILERTKNDFLLAEDKGVPFFITFEDSQDGDHALHAPLKPFLPSQSQDFTKTTYGATGLPSFADAVKTSGLSHLVVIGAETDVCVLQTVLGLRNMGFTVLLQKDAVFTSETNPSPALRRMQQAGTVLVDQAEVADFLADPAKLPDAADPPVTLVDPLHMGVVLNDFTDAALSGGSDPLTKQKSARVRELLLVSEWFDLPVYVSDPGAGLPSAYESYFQGQLRPLSQIAQDGSVTQLVVAGTDGGGLAAAMSSWMQAHDLFVMEDALFARSGLAAQKDMLKPYFAKGLVPITYKTFYYDMTRSTDLAEWPSQEWVQKYDEYYWITEAPEDLPPIQGE